MIVGITNSAKRTKDMRAGDEGVNWFMTWLRS
jgi:hypothetical protein